MKGTVTLPNAREILRRLTTGYDDHDMIERFYPLIMQEAERELLPAGVTLMFVQKIDTFVKSGYPAQFGNILTGFISIWVWELLDDKELAQQAIDYLPEGLRSHN